MNARALSLLALGGIACTSGQAADVGSRASLQVRGGAFYAEALPDQADGPRVEAAYLGQTVFPAAFQNKSFNGVLSVDATAAAVALAGDAGYWVVPAGPPPVETPDLPSFDAALSFSASLAAGPHELLVAAVDGGGRFGPRKTVAFTLSERPLPEGQLVFSLFWDRPSDLDLRVVLPDGVAVDKDNVNSWRAQGNASDSEGFRDGGLLDFDSNAQCRIDGRNNENVVFSAAPPSGRYVAQVLTFSLCGESAARWSAEARYQGERVALATGVSLPSDTRPEAEAAGTTAFELTVP